MTEEKPGITTSWKNVALAIPGGLLAIVSSLVLLFFVAWLAGIVAALAVEGFRQGWDLFREVL